jgi:hypothetical protein
VVQSWTQTINPICGSRFSFRKSKQQFGGGKKGKPQIHADKTRIRSALSAKSAALPELRYDITVLANSSADARNAVPYLAQSASGSAAADPNMAMRRSKQSQ